MSKKPVCTIVGMGPGVALSVAKKFGSQGYEIAMIARNPSALADIQAELSRQGIAAHAFAADAGKTEDLVAALHQVKTHVGLTEVLLYNAASFRQATPLQATVADLVADFQVNVAGALAAVHVVQRDMVERKKGTILLTGGGFALQPMPQMFTLGIGKAAIRNFALSLAVELEPKGVRVGTVTICGMVKEGTPFSPSKIAESFWALHGQKPGSPTEILFQG